jgi:hypothetical protein
MRVFGAVESVTNAKTCAVVPSLRLWFLHHYAVHEDALCLIKVGCFDEDTTLEAVVLLGFVNHCSAHHYRHAIPCLVGDRLLNEAHPEGSALQYLC